MDIKGISSNYVFGLLIMGSVFGSLFMLEIDVKDNFLLKNEVLLSKNVRLTFVFKKMY